MICVGYNANKKAIYDFAETRDSSKIKTCFERKDIISIREAVRVDAASTTAISQISHYLMD